MLLAARTNIRLRAGMVSAARLTMRHRGGIAFMRDKEYFDMLCNTADGVFIVDSEKRILRWNKGAEDILGYAEADVLNRECYHVIPGKSQDDRILCSQNCKIHSSALKGTPQENFDMLVCGRGDKPLWLNISVFSPLAGGDPFLAHIVRDVTREKTKELAVDQFLASLGASDRRSKEIFGKRSAQKNDGAAKSAPADKTVLPLSDREIQVLTLLAEGHSTKTMAQRLGISHFTARNHIQNILMKLDLHSKAQAVSYAFKRGIL